VPAAELLPELGLARRGRRRAVAATRRAATIAPLVGVARAGRATTAGLLALGPRTCGPLGSGPVAPPP
jgi:hypothetical protein